MKQQHPSNASAAKGSSPSHISIPGLCSSQTDVSSLPRLPAKEVAETSANRRLPVQRDLRRSLQAERKRRWRHNQTPEQKERRKLLDATRKRRERENQTDEQRAENRRKDALRKAAKRERAKLQNAHQNKNGMSGNSANKSARPVAPVGDLVHVAPSNTYRQPVANGKSAGERDSVQYSNSSKKYSANSIQSILN